MRFPVWLDYFFKKTWIKAIVFLLFWIPAYIGAFPGNFVYDSANEYNQITTGFTADFPLIHSFLVTNALSFSKNITGSAVCGIAVLTAAQAILLAFIFSYMITVFLPKRSKFCLFGAEYIVYRSFSGNSDIGCITCPRCFFRRFIYALRHISV